MDYQKMYYALLRAVESAIKAGEEGDPEKIMDILLCGKQKAEEIYIGAPGAESLNDRSEIEKNAGQSF